MNEDFDLEAIETREQEHRADHERMGSLMESCLPGGCGPDNDIQKLIAEVRRLRKPMP